MRALPSVPSRRQAALPAASRKGRPHQSGTGKKEGWKETPPAGKPQAAGYSYPPPRRQLRCPNKEPHRLPGPRPAPLRAPGEGSGASPIRYGAAGGAGRSRKRRMCAPIGWIPPRGVCGWLAQLPLPARGRWWRGAGAGGGRPEVTRRGGAAWPRLWCSGDLRAGGAGTGGCAPPARRWVRSCPSPRLQRLRSERRAVVAAWGKAGPFQGLPGERCCRAALGGRGPSAPGRPRSRPAVRRPR